MEKVEQKIIKHFRKNDRILFSAIKDAGMIQKLLIYSPENYFQRLCREIIGQQLSGKVSNAIFSRFKELFSNKKITPRKVLKIPTESMREAGLSYAKTGYVKNLAEKIVKKDLSFNDFVNLDNKQIIEELSRVKGIGDWTAEMFLMFALGREDIFSFGDLGLKKAIKQLYKFNEYPTKEEMEKISSKWTPYKSYACSVLWKSLDI